MCVWVCPQMYTCASVCIGKWMSKWIKMHTYVPNMYTLACTKKCTSLSVCLPVHICIKPNCSYVSRHMLKHETHTYANALSLETEHQLIFSLWQDKHYCCWPLINICVPASIKTWLFLILLVCFLCLFVLLFLFFLLLCFCLLLGLLYRWTSDAVLYKRNAAGWCIMCAKVKNKSPASKHPM